MENKYLYERIYKNKFYEYFFIYLFLSIILVFVDCFLHNGYLLLLFFLLFSFVIGFKYGTAESLFPFYLVLMLNNSMLETKINFIGGLSIGIIIKVLIWILFLGMLLKTKIWSKSLVPVWIYIIWGTYLTLNTFLNRVDNFFNVVFYLTSPMVISISAQWVAGKRKKEYSCMIVAAIVAALVVSCFFGYFELLVGKTYYYSIWTGAERYRYGILRVGSTSADPNFLCLTNITIFALTSISQIKDLIGKKNWYILAFFVSAQVILTFSRTGVLCLIAVLLLLVSEKHKKIFVIAIPILSVMVAFLVNTIFDSFETLDINSYLSRMRVVELSFQYWKENALFGYGYNGFYNISSQLLGEARNTMNEYINELTSFGIVGLCLYGIYIFYIFKVTCGSIRNLYSAKYGKNNYRICCFAALTSWCVMSISLDTYSKLALWLIPSVVVAIKNLVVDGECI